MHIFRQSFNRTALVTGASSGIGKAITHELLDRDWNVVGVSRRAGNFENPNYSHLKLDLSRIKNLATTVEDELGGRVSSPDLERFAIVNNAADPGLLGTVDQIDPTAMLRIYAINVAAPTWLMGWLVRHGRPGLVKRIANVSTGAAVDPYPGMGAYCNTKAALRMSGMVLAAELDASETESDISILSYEPGIVDTEMQEMMRASSIETLPIVGVFENFHKEGMLVPASGPANEIADYLEADDHPRFTEARLG